MERPKITLQQFKAGNGNDTTGVPTDDLRDILRKKLVEIGRSTTMIHDEQSEYAGAIELVAERATKLINANRPEGTPLVRTPSIYRRISGILAGESEVTDLGIADALLLACELHLGLTDLIVLPGSNTGARKMVEAYYADKNWGSEKTIERLAHKLERFCLGFTNGPLICGDEEALERAAYRAQLAAKRKARRKKTEQEEVAA